MFAVGVVADLPGLKPCESGPERSKSALSAQLIRGIAEIEAMRKFLLLSSLVLLTLSVACKGDTSGQSEASGMPESALREGFIVTAGDETRGLVHHFCADGRYLEETSVLAPGAEQDSVCGEMRQGVWKLENDALTVRMEQTCRSGDARNCQPVDCKPAPESAARPLFDAASLRELRASGVIESVDSPVLPTYSSIASSDFCKQD
jgi:hypothetical protein